MLFAIMTGMELDQGNVVFARKGQIVFWSRDEAELELDYMVSGDNFMECKSPDRRVVGVMASWHTDVEEDHSINVVFFESGRLRFPCLVVELPEVS